jgi:hypothetical protein
MTSKRIFYQNIITVNILSKEPLTGDEDLTDLQTLLDDGTGVVGRVHTTIENEEVGGLRMAQLLNEEDFDPAEFGLDDEGNDVDEDDDENNEEEEIA